MNRIAPQSFLVNRNVPFLLYIFFCVLALSVFSALLTESRTGWTSGTAGIGSKSSSSLSAGAGPTSTVSTKTTKHQESFNGTVASVNCTDNILVVHQTRGEDLTLTFSKTTKYRKEDTKKFRCGDIEVGDYIHGRYYVQSDSNIVVTADDTGHHPWP